MDVCPKAVGHPCIDNFIIEEYDTIHDRIPVTRGNPVHGIGPNFQVAASPTPLLSTF